MLIPTPQILCRKSAFNVKFCAPFCFCKQARIPQVIISYLSYCTTAYVIKAQKPRILLNFLKIFKSPVVRENEGRGSLLETKRHSQEIENPCFEKRRLSCRRNSTSMGNHVTVGLNFASKGTFFCWQ